MLTQFELAKNLINNLQRLTQNYLLCLIQDQTHE